MIGFFRIIGFWQVLSRCAVLAVITVACSVLPTACGTPAPGAEPVPPPPSPDSFASALVMTRTWAAAEITATASAHISGLNTQWSGAGEVAMDKGHASFTWSGPQGTRNELVNDRGIFTQTGTRGVWVRTDGHTSTSAFADPLRGLSSLRQVTRTGSARIEGFDADVYRGSLPVTASNLESLGLDDEQIAAATAKTRPTDSIAVTAWVDPHHRLVRIDRTLNLSSDPDADASATIELNNFGVMVDFESPPSASVTTQG